MNFSHIIETIRESSETTSVGRQNISQSKEAVFYSNWSKVMTYLEEFINNFPGDEARAKLVHESIVELLQETTRLSETTRYFETYINQQRLTIGPEEENSF